MLWKKPKRRKRRSPSPRPSLRFSPTAWAKLRYLRDFGETEIGGFGLSAPEDPLLITDVLIVKQRCTVITVALDDTAIADLFDKLVDEGLRPERFSRVWIHTHPGDCPLPSSTDETTFRRVFGRTDWSVMAILARDDSTYARLAFHAGPGASLELPVRVDYDRPFEATTQSNWNAEYLESVQVETLSARMPHRLRVGPPAFEEPESFWTETWPQEDFYGGIAAEPV